MNDEINYESNPLHGLGLQDLLTQIVDHYGFDLLYAYLNINCFKTNPSIESSVKFSRRATGRERKLKTSTCISLKTCLVCHLSSLPSPLDTELSLKANLLANPLN